MLEVWNEIRVELEQQNIRPVSPDADAITEITKRLNDSAIAVAETQVCMNAWADAWLLGWGGFEGKFCALQFNKWATNLWKHYRLLCIT